MIRTFKNKRSAKSDGLLGEGGQDPRSEKREPREGEGEEGIECTSAMRNRPDAPMWGSSSNEGWQARSTHVCGPGAGKESTHRKKGLSEHRELTHATTKRKEGKPHIHYYTEIW